MSLTTGNALAFASQRLTFLTPLLVATVIWGFAVLGTFETTDGLVYDLFMGLRTRISREAPRVLLLEADNPDQLRDEANLLVMLDKLAALKAKLVAFNSLPPIENERFYRRAQSSKNVLLARTIASDPDPSGEVHLEGTALFKRYPELKFGIVHAPPTVQGICRGQHSYFIIDGKPYPGLEVKAANEVLATVPKFNYEPFLIDFRGGPGSLPRLALSRLLSDDLISELVKGRCVLVGSKQPATLPGLYTPTGKDQATMSNLEYQGQALNSLLSGRTITVPSNTSRYFILLITVLCYTWLYHWGSINITWWLTVFLIGIFGAGGLVSFVGVGTWLPPTEVVLCQAILLLSIVRRRALNLTDSLKQLIADSTTNLRDKYWPVHLDPSNTSWSLLANMIHQTLDLNKLIFLEADRGNSRLREMFALHCSLNDIAERRRDHGRAPYSDAVNAKGPIAVQGYLKTKDEKERQYLIPLIFCDELLGFWAIGIDASKIANIPNFDGVLRDYTSRISELLHDKKKATSPSGDLSGINLGAPVDEAEDSHKDLSSTLGLLQQRLGSLDILINSLNSGIIVYDIFGRILQINEVMLLMLKKENLVPFEMTALDMIMSLSDYDISRARKLLRRVIVDNDQVSFPVTFRSNKRSRFLMNLKPLVESSNEASSAQQSKRKTKSILCELVETTTMAMVYEMKSRLTERLCLQIRNDLAPIDLSWSMLQDTNLQLEDRKLLAEVIQSKMRKSVTTLSECQQYLATDADVDELDRFPVDPKAPLELALEELKTSLGRQAVTFQVNQPHFVSYVFASTDKLKDLLKAILLVLSKDATDDSNILVRLTESDDVVAFDFSNMGFGIPNELLQQYLFGDQPVASTELQTVADGTRWVEAWGGTMEAFSDVGVGMHFTVHLVKFI